MHKKTIIHDLIKIKDLYFVWNSEKSRPLTHGMKKYELQEWVKVNEGEFGAELLDKRFVVLDEKGLSIPDNEIINLPQFISNNKSSKDRKFLSEEEIYILYTYNYIDDLKENERNRISLEKQLNRLPEEISMSSKFYFFFIIATLLIIGLYYIPEIPVVNSFIIEYKINIEKINLILFTLLGILLGIIASPKLYLWNYKR